MDSEFQPQDEVVELITRCAEAVDDLDRLRDELHGLRLSSDPMAQFATALFELELARRGDEDARAEVLTLADALLVFWHEGTGARLALVHPVVEDLWASAAALLASFEVKRFHNALAACWKARTDVDALLAAVEGLLPEGNRRVEFARCLYHLELARLGVQPSRAEFAHRAWVLLEAFQSKTTADQLVGSDTGLRRLWGELRPDLDEFFEGLEEEARRRKKRSGALPVVMSQTGPLVKTEPSAQVERKTDPAGTLPKTDPLREAPRSDVPKTDPNREVPQPAAPAAQANPGWAATPVGLGASTAPTKPLVTPGGAVTPTVLPQVPGPPPGVPISSPSSSSLTTQPNMQAVPPPPRRSPKTEPGVTPVGLEARRIPSFRTLVGMKKQSASALPPEAEALEQPDQDERSARAAPAPQPPEEIELVDAEEADAPVAPPPPADLTPPGQWLPPRSESGEVELVEAEEVLEPPAPTPPPAPAPSRPRGPAPSSPRGPTPSLDVALEDDYVPDATTIAFWQHTLDTLSLLPDPTEGRAAQRLLACDTRAERAKLNGYLESIEGALHVPEARALSCLIRLMLSAQLKEKSLFGQSNARRAEAFAQALSLLSADPRAAGHAAVWFALDGPITEAALQKGLDVLIRFVGFCARSQLNPLDATAHQAFLSQGDLS